MIPPPTSQRAVTTTIARPVLSKQFEAGNGVGFCLSGYFNTDIPVTCRCWPAKRRQLNPDRRQLGCRLSRRADRRQLSLVGRQLNLAELSLSRRPDRRQLGCRLSRIADRRQLGRRQSRRQLKLNLVRRLLDLAELSLGRRESRGIHRICRSFEV